MLSELVQLTFHWCRHCQLNIKPYPSRLKKYVNMCNKAKLWKIAQLWFNSRALGAIEPFSLPSFMFILNFAQYFFEIANLKLTENWQYSGRSSSKVDKCFMLSYFNSKPDFGKLCIINSLCQVHSQIGITV